MSAFHRAWRTFRDQGARTVLQKAIARAFPVASTRPSLVREEDVLAVDWRDDPPWRSTPRRIGSGPLTVAWVMSPPGANSGGHQNIFRFIRVLEQAGHRVRVYLYSTFDPTTAEQSAERVRGSSSYPDVAATIEDYPDGGVPADVDAIFATSWETAYPAYRDPSDARRFYFVQDFEPAFYPAGTEAVLAENTYRFGFTGVTAGGWLSTKLARDYGMTASPFEFGADPGHYRLVDAGPREGVFFYARPETPRRGFELGILALELVARERPGTPIVLAGQVLRRHRVPFPHENPGNVQVGDLNALYNRCAAGLVLSLTNLSLLPLELLAAGVVPIVNDGENNRLVSDNPFIAYAPASPRALADRILEVLDRDDRDAYARRAAASVATTGWTAAADQFLAAVERGARG